MWYFGTFASIVFKKLSICAGLRVLKRYQSLYQTLVPLWYRNAVVSVVVQVCGFFERYHTWYQSYKIFIDFRKILYYFNTDSIFFSNKFLSAYKIVNLQVFVLSVFMRVCTVYTLLISIEQVVYTNSDTPE